GRARRWRIEDGRRARGVVDVVLPERHAEVDIDRMNRFGSGADERDRLESAEPDQPIEQDWFGERGRRFWFVFQLQLPEKLERTERARLRLRVARDAWIGANPAAALRVESARRPFDRAASLCGQTGGAAAADRADGNQRSELIPH